jgi:transportin-1
MPELVSQIEEQPRAENVSVCNNAAWATGEIALQYGSDQELHQWITPLMERLIPVLLNPKSVKSLTENAAVTIGRLGLVCPQLVAPHLEMFIERWCQALWDIKDNDEKDSAFRGLCQMIKVNPNGGE